MYSSNCNTSTIIPNLTSMFSKFLPVDNPTKSFWHSRADQFAKHRTTPTLPAHADVVIIGSGYAGTTTAYYLMKGSSTPLNVTMLEARDVCSGATGRNGGHLKPDLYYNTLSFTDKYGEKGCADIANFEYAHIAAMKELIEAEQIDCDFVLTRAVDVHLSPEANERCLRNYQAMMKNPYITCKSDLQLLTGEQAKVTSKSEDTEVAVSYTAGQMWPYKLITTILKRLIDKYGLNLQTNTPALSVSKLSDGKWEIVTPRGSIVTSKVVLATNAYTASVDSRFIDKIVPIKGICCHITASNKSERTPHLSNTYGIRNDHLADGDYLINRPDGSVVVGGAKKHIFPFKERFYNNVDDSSLIDGTSDYFTDDYMQKRFYTWKNFESKPDYIWSGILGYTDDSLPYVGEIEPGKYIIAGFHGHGMPRVLLCAKALALALETGAEVEGIPDSFKATPKRLASTQNTILKALGTPTAKL